MRSSRLVDDLEAFDTHTVLLGLGLGPLHEPQLMLLERDLGVQAVVLGRNFGLLFQLVQIGIELAQNVFHTGEILGRGREAVFRLTTTLLVLETPAASSRNRRSSSGRDSMMRLIVPWPMMA